MSQQHARSWWTEVEHLRPELERRRAHREDRHLSVVRDRAPGPDAREEAPPPSDSGPVEQPVAPPRPVDDWSVEQAPVRRTVEIRGRTVAAPAAPHAEAGQPRRRPMRTPAQRLGPQPDRIALWAVVLGIVMILAAAFTSHAEAAAIAAALAG